MEYYTAQSYEGDTDSVSYERKHGQKRTKKGQHRRKKSRSHRRRHSDSTEETTVYESPFHAGYALRNSFRGYDGDYLDAYVVYPDPESSVSSASTTPLTRDPKWKKLIKPKIYGPVLVLCFIGLLIGTAFLASLRYQEETPLVGTVSAQLELTLNNTFNEKYADTTSQEFIQLEQDFCDQIRVTYRKTGSSLRNFYDSCSIETLERGSIRVTFLINFKSVTVPIPKERFISVLYLNIKLTQDGYGDFGNLKIIMTSLTLIKVIYNPILTTRPTTPTTSTTTTTTTSSQKPTTATTTTTTSQAPTTTTTTQAPATTTTSQAATTTTTSQAPTTTTTSQAPTTTTTSQATTTTTPQATTTTSTPQVSSITTTPQATSTMTTSQAITTTTPQATTTTVTPQATTTTASPQATSTTTTSQGITTTATSQATTTTATPQATTTTATPQAITTTTTSQATTAATASQATTTTAKPQASSTKTTTSTTTDSLTHTTTETFPTSSTVSSSNTMLSTISILTSSSETTTILTSSSETTTDITTDTSTTTTDITTDTSTTTTDMTTDTSPTTTDITTDTSSTTTDITTDTSTTTTNKTTDTSTTTTEITTDTSTTITDMTTDTSPTTTDITTDTSTTTTDITTDTSTTTTDITTDTSTTTTDITTDTSTTTTDITTDTSPTTTDITTDTSPTTTDITTDTSTTTTDITTDTSTTTTNITTDTSTTTTDITTDTFTTTTDVTTDTSTTTTDITTDTSPTTTDITTDTSTTTTEITTDTSTTTAVSTTEIPVPILSMKGLTLQPFSSSEVQCELTNLHNWENITILKNGQLYAITFSNGSTVQTNIVSKVTFHGINNNATVTVAFVKNLSHCQEEGQYTCTASGAWGSTSITAMVTVSANPKNITIESNGPYDEGTRRTLAVCYGFITHGDSSVKLMVKKQSDTDFIEFNGQESNAKEENNSCVLNAKVSYSFVPSSDYNGTQVKCVAVNSQLGLTVSSDVKVIVVTMREISFNKYDHQAELGSFIESTCSCTSPTWQTLKIVKLVNTNKITLFKLDKVNGLSVSSLSPRVTMTSQIVNSTGVKFSFNFTTVNCTDEGQYMCVVNDSIAELESPVMKVVVTRAPKVKSFKLSAHQTVSYNRPEYKHACTGDPGYPTGKFRIEVLKPNAEESSALTTSGGVYDVAEESWNCETTGVTWTFLIKFEADMNGGTALCNIDNAKETSSENATVELIPDDFCENIGIDDNVLPHPSNCHWFVECYGNPTGRSCSSPEQCYVSPPSGHAQSCVDCGTAVCQQDITTTSTTVATTVSGPFRIDCNDTTEYIGTSSDIICKVLASKFSQIDVKKSSNQQSVAVIASDGKVTNYIATSPTVHFYTNDQGMYVKISFINITCEDDGGYQLVLTSGNNSFSSNGNLNVQALPSTKPSVTVNTMAEGSSAKFICTGDVGNPAVGDLAIEFWDTATSSYKRETTSRSENEYQQCTNIKKVAFDKVLKSEMNGTNVRCITTYIDPLSNNQKTLISPEHAIIVIPVSICGGGDRYVKHPYDCRKHITCDVGNNRIFEQSCNTQYCIDVKTGHCDALCDCEQTEGVTKYDCEYYRSGEWRIPRQDTYPDKCKTYKWCNNGVVVEEEAHCLGSTYVHKASNGSDYCTMTYSDSHCAKEALTDNRTTTPASTAASEFDCATYPTGQWRIPRNDTYPNKCSFYTWCNEGNFVRDLQCTGGGYFNKPTQGGDFCVLQHSESYCAQQAAKTTTTEPTTSKETIAAERTTSTESASTATTAAEKTTSIESVSTASIAAERTTTVSTVSTDKTEAAKTTTTEPTTSKETIAAERTTSTESASTATTAAEKTTSIESVSTASIAAERTTTVSTVSTDKTEALAVIRTTTPASTAASEFDCATYPTGQWRIPRNDTYPNKCSFYTWCNEGKVVGSEQCQGEGYFNKPTKGGDFCVLQYLESYCARQGG